LDRVVGVRPHRLGEVDADLALDHVERGDELDVADVVAAEVDVHQALDELVVRGVLVVGHSLEERVGAVADADDGDADLLLAADRAVRRAVRVTHLFASKSCLRTCRTRWATVIHAVAVSRAMAQGRTPHRASTRAAGMTTTRSAR